MNTKKVVEKNQEIESSLLFACVYLHHLIFINRNEIRGTISSFFLKELQKELYRKIVLKCKSTLYSSGKCSEKENKYTFP